MKIAIASLCLITANVLGGVNNNNITVVSNPDDERPTPPIVPIFSTSDDYNVTESDAEDEVNFCPILLDDEISDCVKVEKVMDLLKNYSYAGEYCLEPAEMLDRLRQCCAIERNSCGKEIFWIMLDRAKLLFPDFKDSQ